MHFRAIIILGCHTSSKEVGFTQWLVFPNRGGGKAPEQRGGVVKLCAQH